MTSTYSISGLASGLDWQSMISQLVEIERKPITLLEQSKTVLNQKKSAWSEVNTMLLSLRNAADSLSSPDDFNLFKPSATITGTSRGVEDLLSFAVGSNASEGTYSIKVKHLATAQKLASANFSSTTEALGISGNITINGREISVAATDSLSDIQKEINALNSGDNPADVTASIICVSNGEYRLTLTSKETGAEGMTITDGTGSLGLTELVAGQDAEIVLDGFTITRDTNQISDVISGVTLNLIDGDENATITLNVSRDNGVIKEKVQELVDAYNKLMSYISTQNTAAEKGKTKEPLFADSSLLAVKNSLRSVILSGVSGLDSTLNHLSLIGVNLDKTGQLSVNDNKLDGYLESNFEEVINLFVAQGSSTSSNLTYIDSGRNAVEGDYVVTISQAATKTSAVFSGFSGTLVSNTTLTLTSSSGAEQSITLSAGSNITDIVNAVNAGNTLGITAESADGQLRLTSDYYGSQGNFTVSVSGGDLGMAEITQGIDVAGTIRKQGSAEEMTMTGRGQILTGDGGQDVDGLVIRYAGTDAGTLDFSLIKGIAEKLGQKLDSMSDSIDGYVANKQKSLQNQMDNIDKKIDKMEIRLTKYQETLIAKYTAMEKLLSTLQAQQSWLTGQLNSLSNS